MANLKDIKNRITSVSSNIKITSAMKMVSASKLKKSVDKMESFKDFERKFNDIKDNCLSNNISILQDNPLINPKCKENKILILSVASNRGLCGPFNSNISKKNIELINNDFKNYKCDIISVSKKVYEVLNRFLSDTNIKSKEELLNDDSYKNISFFSEEIISSFKKGNYKKVVFVYNSFKSASVQIIKSEIILPVSLGNENNDENINSDFIFEPTKKEILDSIIPKSVSFNIYRIILESIASEHGSRMTAMHKATENAKDLQKELLLDYNKIRQTAITNQIIEIVSGADAV